MTPWAVAGCIGATLQLVGGILEALDRTGPGEPGYPLRTGIIGVAYLLLIGTAVALERSRAWDQSRAGWIGLVVTSVGWLLSGVAQFVLSVRFEVAEQVLFPIATAMIGAGMIFAGVVIVRTHRWRGWHRWIALICGLYPFLVLFPAFAATGGPNFAVLTGWGGCWLAAGVAALRHSRPRYVARARIIADPVPPPSASHAPTSARRHAFAVVIGAAIGVTWSAALRGWMAQLAGVELSFTWLSLGLIALPGAMAGALLGRAADAHLRARTPRRFLVWAPLLLAAPLVNPEILLLSTPGYGSGSILVMVVVTGLSAGYALTHWQLSPWTVLCGTFAVGGFAATALFASTAGSMTTARGAWVCVFGLSLVLVLTLASMLPHRELPRLGWRGHVGIGGLCGLAWAGGLRSFMAAVVGPESRVTWVNTMLWILLVGAIVGALLGSARWRRMTGRPRPALTAAPLLFAAVLLPGLLHPTSMFADGIGGGAIGVPLLGMAGAYALSGRRSWARVVCGSLFLAGMTLWTVVAADVGGNTFALDTARGLWATMLFLGLLMTLALAAAIPLKAGQAS